MADEQVKVDDPFGSAEVDMEVDSSLSPSGAWFDPREASAPPQASKAHIYLGSPCTPAEGDSTPGAVAGSDTEFAGSDASSEDEAAREDANV